MQLTHTVALTFAVGAYAVVPAVEHVEAFVRDLTTIQMPRDLSRRQSDKCSSEGDDFISILTNDPPPTPKDNLLSSLATYYASNDVPTATGCETVSITGEVGSSYTEWSDSFMTWWTTHTTDFQEIWSACSDVGDFSSSLNELASGCSTLLAEATGTSDSTKADSSDSAKADSSDKSNDDSSDDNEDAAPRQTGAAMVAAGVAAVVALAL